MFHNKTKKLNKYGIGVFVYVVLRLLLIACCRQTWLCVLTSSLGRPQLLTSYLTMSRPLFKPG